MMDYSQILDSYPWLIQPNQNAVISFDADGWATGVLLAHMLNWKIVGYYDSEILILKNGMHTDDCVFIDVEIFREAKRSFGHHLIIYDFNLLPNDFASRTKNCFNPNFYRRLDKRHSYTRKYPLATFHLYCKILKEAGLDSLYFTSSSALSVIWFIDGLMNIRYNYTPNVTEWISFLQMQNEPWYVEMNNRSEADVKTLATEFITAVNTVADYSAIKRLQYFSPTTLTNLLGVIAAKLGLENKIENWCMSDYTSIKFKRQFMDIATESDFDRFWNQHPFSMSTYFRNKISFTLEEPQPLP